MAISGGDTADGALKMCVPCARYFVVQPFFLSRSSSFCSLSQALMFSLLLSFECAALHVGAMSRWLPSCSDVSI